MIFTIEYNYNTRKWHSEKCPTWLWREMVRLDSIPAHQYWTPTNLLESAVYVGF